MRDLNLTIARINGSKNLFPGRENRAHRPTHKISSADKIYKRSFFTDFLFVRILEDREFLPESVERFHIQDGGGCGGGVVWHRGEDCSFGIDDGRTSIIMADGVVAYPVDSYHKTLVLEGTGLQQHIPYPAAAGWPVGNIDDGVVKRFFGFQVSSFRLLREKHGKRRS